MFHGRTDVAPVLPTNKAGRARFQYAHLHPYYYVIRIGPPRSQCYHLCGRHSNLRAFHYPQLRAGPSRRVELYRTLLLKRYNCFI